MEGARRLLDLLRIHGLLNGVKLGILLALYHIDGLHHVYGSTKGVGLA